jgi:hypothetical protein
MKGNRFCHSGFWVDLLYLLTNLRKIWMALTSGRHASTHIARLHHQMPPRPPSSMFGKLALYLVDMTPLSTWPDLTTAVLVL